MPSKVLPRLAGEVGTASGPEKYKPSVLCYSMDTLEGPPQPKGTSGLLETAQRPLGPPLHPDIDWVSSIDHKSPHPHRVPREAAASTPYPPAPPAPNPPLGESRAQLRCGDLHNRPPGGGDASPPNPPPTEQSEVENRNPLPGLPAGLGRQAPPRLR